MNWKLMFVIYMFQVHLQLVCISICCFYGTDSSKFIIFLTRWYVYLYIYERMETKLYWNKMACIFIELNIFRNVVINKNITFI